MVEVYLLRSLVWGCAIQMAFLLVEMSNNCVVAFCDRVTLTGQLLDLDVVFEIVVVHKVECITKVGEWFSSSFVVA